MIKLEEYLFLTDQTEQLHGTPKYNLMVDTCKAFRWMTGFNRDGVPVLTELGKHEIKKFEEGEDSA